MGATTSMVYAPVVDLVKSVTAYVSALGIGSGGAFAAIKLNDPMLAGVVLTATTITAALLSQYGCRTMNPEMHQENNQNPDSIYGSLR
jgi:hypothetical protein